MTDTLTNLSFSSRSDQIPLTKMMNNQTIQEEFERCKWIWYLYLCELNWNYKAINPLEILYEFYGHELSNLLREAKFIGQNQEFYLNQSDKYIDFLSKGGRPYVSKAT